MQPQRARAGRKAGHEDDENNTLAGRVAMDSDVRGVPLHYVSRDDYRTDIKDIRDMLGKIFDRLDGKADK